MTLAHFVPTFINSNTVSQIALRRRRRQTPDRRVPRADHRGQRGPDPGRRHPHLHQLPGGPHEADRSGGGHQAQL